MAEPKILLLDIETTPFVSLTWTRYDVKRAHVLEGRYVLSIAYKWLGDDDTEVIALPDFKTAYKRDRTDDSRLIQRIHALESEADMVIGHNGDGFDMKRIRGRYLMHGLEFPGRTPSVDTLKVIKRHTVLDSHRLDDVCAELGIGSKLPHSGIETWWGCMQGDAESWDTMRAYNAHDVDPLLEGLYLYLRDHNWIDNHPNLAAITGRLAACTTCGIDGPYHNRGFTGGRGPRYRKVKMLNCGHYNIIRKAEPHSAPIFK